jgi:hypothetical protein
VSEGEFRTHRALLRRANAVNKSWFQQIDIVNAHCVGSVFKYRGQVVDFCKLVDGDDTRFGPSTMRMVGPPCHYNEQMCKQVPLSCGWNTTIIAAQQFAACRFQKEVL